MGGWGRVGSMLLLRGSKRASAELIGSGIILLLCLFLGWGDCDRKVDLSFVGPGLAPVALIFIPRGSSFDIAKFRSLLHALILSGQS